MTKQNISTKKLFQKKREKSVTNSVQKLELYHRFQRMMKWKTHLGHKSFQHSRGRLWYPELAPSFLGFRHGMPVINPQETLKATVKALYFAALVLRKNGRLLLVDTRHEFSPFSHIAMKMPEVLNASIAMAGKRWIGGTLTNWSSLSPHVSQFGHAISTFQPAVSRFKLSTPRFKKMKEAFPGFLVVNRDSNEFISLKFRERPDLLIICQPNENQMLLREAFSLQIPVLAFVDSNTCPDYITYPIPLNTENHEWMYYCLDLLSRFANCFSLVKHS
ncbi:MAG: 30S ribosomal protein S2 [Candidatus Staskawiczbacteria bacterium]|nr:30S ribosomal protein S2 [Candidatus Staskawiczbacteria bacterium]